jgi:hypothetical protein
MTKFTKGYLVGYVAGILITIMFSGCASKRSAQCSNWVERTAPRCN